MNVTECIASDRQLATSSGAILVRKYLAAGKYARGKGLAVRQS
jgi:hypothetical protein